MSDFIEEFDWYGKWLVDGDTRFLVELSEEYKASKEEAEQQPPEPTIEYYMLDLDYRISLIELGL